MEEIRASCRARTYVRRRATSWCDSLRPLAHNDAVRSEMQPSSERPSAGNMVMSETLQSAIADSATVVRREAMSRSGPIIVRQPHRYFDDFRTGQNTFLSAAEN
jgi:hypothetical protein